jgi:uncharacterized protein YdaU (DUF1376 family)
MAQEPAPAFLFYVRDWLGDAKVRAMSPEARGVYIDLLAYCWQEGSLPADAAQLARLVGLPAPAFRRIWPQLEPCFVLVDGDRWRQKRLDQERDRQRLRRTLAAHKGAKGAAARWRTAAPAAMPGPCPGHSPGTAQAVPGDRIAFAMAKEELREGQRADAPAPDPVNPRVLQRLTYELPAGLVDEADARDELKTLAARYRLPYDGASISQALDRRDHARAAAAAAADGDDRLRS